MPESNIDVVDESYVITLSICKFLLCTVITVSNMSKLK